MELGRVIYWLRRGHGVSQAQMSRELGVSEGYIALIESGARKISTSMMRKFVDYFGIPVTLFSFLQEYPALQGKHQNLVDFVLNEYPVLVAVLKEIETEDRLTSMPKLREPYKLGIRRKRVEEHE